VPRTVPSSQLAASQIQRSPRYSTGFAMPRLYRQTWVLDLGCGNSEFPEVMARGGTDGAAQSTKVRRRGTTPSVGYVLGVDYSSTGVLESMSCRARERGLSGAVDYRTDDVRTLPFRDPTVDVVVDKGCLDSVLQDADQVRLSMRWQRHTSRDVEPLLRAATRQARSVVEEVCRVLSPGGIFVVVSYEPPAGRADILRTVNDPRWALEVAGDEDEHGNYVYVCRKGCCGAARADAGGA